jgi:hypothetical protein
MGTTPCLRVMRAALAGAVVLPSRYDPGGCPGITRIA